MATSDRTDSPIQIQLTKGYVTIVDPVDGDLAAYHWAAFSGPKNPDNIYSRRSLQVNRKTTGEFLHRVILGRVIGRQMEKGEYVDHIDGNSLNNRRGNLRLSTRSQNGRNSKISKNNKSGFKGAYWHKVCKRWTACIRVDGKSKHLGYFDTAEQAHSAYMEAAAMYYGEFAASAERSRIPVTGEALRPVPQPVLL